MDTSKGMRLDAALRDAATRIDRNEAALLLSHVLSQPRAWLYAHGDAPLEARAMVRFEGLVARRVGGEPIAYLTGTRGFWTFELAVSPVTLIPRAETELLVGLALARIPADAATAVADLGTGSGAIALAIASERPLARVTATDASLDALAIAQANAERLGIANVRFRHGNWCDALPDEQLHLIAGNPPYIAAGDAHLAQGDLRFEPVAALVSGGDGLDAIRSIARDAPSRLTRHGWLLLEHGMEQGDAVRQLLRDAGFVEVETERDLEGRERVTLGRRPD